MRHLEAGVALTCLSLVKQCVGSSDYGPIVLLPRTSFDMSTTHYKAAFFHAGFQLAPCPCWGTRWGASALPPVGGLSSQPGVFYEMIDLITFLKGTSAHRVPASSDGLARQIGAILRKHMPKALILGIGFAVWYYYPRKPCRTVIHCVNAPANPQVNLNFSGRLNLRQNLWDRIVSPTPPPITRIAQYTMVDFVTPSHPDDAVIDPEENDLSVTRSESSWEAPTLRIITHSDNHVEVIKTSRISPFFNGSTYVDERAAQHRPAPFVATRCRVAYFLVETVHCYEPLHLGTRDFLERVTRTLGSFSGINAVVTDTKVVLACPAVASDNRAGTGIMAIGDTQKAMYRRLALYNIPPLFDVVPGTSLFLEATRAGN